MKLKRKLSYSQMEEEIQKNILTFKNLYLTQNMTAAKVAENQNIYIGEFEFKNNFAKALLRVCGKKGMGRGGARQGSGNKKGIKFPNRKKTDNDNQQQDELE